MSGSSGYLAASRSTSALTAASAATRSVGAALAATVRRPTKVSCSRMSRLVSEMSGAAMPATRSACSLIAHCARAASSNTALAAFFPSSRPLMPPVQLPNCFTICVTHSQRRGSVGCRS